MVAPAEVAPWYPDNTWGRSPDGAEPPLPACWLPPPLITVEDLPVWSEDDHTGTGQEISVDPPAWDPLPEPWLDPITGTTITDTEEADWISTFPCEPVPADPSQDGSTTDVEIAPEPELPEETPSWVDPILGEYRFFLEENPQWLEDNGGGGMQIQVMTPSQFLPWIELGTPGQATAFDRWYHQTYLASEGGEFEGEGMVSISIASMQLRNLPVFSTNLEPGLLAPSPGASLSTEPSPPAQDGWEPAAMAADRPTSVETSNPFPTDSSPIRSQAPSRSVGVPARNDQAAIPGAERDPEASIPASLPLPAAEGVSPLASDHLLTPLALHWPDLSLWRPARLETPSQE